MVSVLYLHIPSESCGPFQGIENPLSLLSNTGDKTTGLSHLIQNPLFIFMVIIFLGVYIYYLKSVQTGNKKEIANLKQTINSEREDNKKKIENVRSSQLKHNDYTSFF